MAHNLGAYDSAQVTITGKTCCSTILSKILFFDILRQLKECGALMENDAKACFDRVLPALAVLTCQCLGLPHIMAPFMFKTLCEMTFSVATSHGISQTQYLAHDDPTDPGQGSGQGSGSGIMLWLMQLVTSI